MTALGWRSRSSGSTYFCNSHYCCAMLSRLTLSVAWEPSNFFLASSEFLVFSPCFRGNTFPPTLEFKSLILMQCFLKCAARTAEGMRDDLKWYTDLVWITFHHAVKKAALFNALLILLTRRKSHFFLFFLTAPFLIKFTGIAMVNKIILIFFSLFKKFLLLFNYSFMPFLPIPPPHPSRTPSLPKLHPPPWFCPCVPL